MLLPAGGDVGLQTPLLAGFQVGGAAVAGICNEGIRQLTGVGLDPLQPVQPVQPVQQVHRIAGLVAHADGHDYLVVSVHSGLGVVALNPAVRSLEDVAVGIGEILLSLRFGVAGCIGWQRALRHCQLMGLGSGGNGAQLQVGGLSLLDRQLLSLICPFAPSLLRCSSPLASDASASCSAASASSFR